jgi:hypothetical protein
LNSMVTSSPDLKSLRESSARTGLGNIPPNKML